MPLRAILIGTSVGGVVVTSLVSLSPQLAFGYRSLPLHVAIETSAAIVAALTALLVLGRFRQSGAIGDLLLLSALAVLAFTNLILSPLPALTDEGLHGVSTWTSLAGALLGALLLAVSAFASGRCFPGRSRVLAAAIGAPVLLLSLACGIALAFATHLPDGLPPEASPIDPTRPLIVGHPVLLSGQLAASLLFLAAAIGFARRASGGSDELVGWLAAGSLLACFGRANYALFPSLSSQWVYTGDFFRLGSYLVLFVGASREIIGYWRRLAEASVLEERRRIARDLHDGLAQELAFIVAESDGPTAAAAERGLDEARRAIAALTRPVEEPYGIALVQAAEDVAGRVGTRVRATLPATLELPPETGEALIRVVREAVTNAGRHGRASLVTIQLTVEDGLHLSIEDDGSGFDPAAVRGFGLAGMRERIEALGGTFSVVSRPQLGTRIEAVVR